LCSACGDRGESAAAATTTDIDLAAISNNALPTIVLAAVADAHVVLRSTINP
jgi:hypothetical protein